jgi:hypothetical protein
MRALLNLAEVEGRLSVPARQYRLDCEVGRFFKNLLQLPLHLLWNALHGESSWS